MTTTWAVIFLPSAIVAIAVGCVVVKAWLASLATATGRRAARHRNEIERIRTQYRRRRRAMREALTKHRRIIIDLEQAVAGKEVLIDAERAISADLWIQAAVSEARVTDLEARTRKQAAELEALRADVDTTRAKMTATEFEHGILRIEHGELLARTQRVGTLVEATAIGATVQPGPHPASGTARAEAGALRERVAQRDASIHELNRRLEDSEARALELDTQLRTWKYRIAPLVLQLRIQRERNRKLRMMLKGEDAPAPRLLVLASPAEDPIDDLKKIRGIGRSIERKLHSQGIFRFRQLAELTATDLASITSTLAIPATRPWRDRWIDQARQLTQRADAA